MRAIFASLCLIVAAAAPAFAQEAPGPTPGVLDQVYACASVTDQTARLACYDAAVGRLREAQNSGSLVAVDRESVRQVEREGFGFSLPSLSNLFRRGGGGAPAVVEEIAEQQFEIASIAMRRDGTAAFTMTNGQVWSQIDNESPRNARVGGQVTIRRATLGSYLMSVAAGGPALRVRRTQ